MKVDVSVMVLLFVAKRYTIKLPSNKYCYGREELAERNTPIGEGGLEYGTHLFSRSY